MNIREKIIDYAKELNLDTIGFTKCRRFDELEEFFKYRKENDLFNEFEEQDIEKKLNPKLLMENGETIISIAFPYFHGELEQNEINFSLYTQGIDYHKVVVSYLSKICKFINDLGGEAMYFVDSNPLPERYIATLAGIGFIGRNNTLITEKYGSYVFLGEIITNFILEPDKINSKNCLFCDLCVEKCPTNVIIENRMRFNSRSCVSYLTQKKSLNNHEINLIKGSIFGCDECQRICPHNKNVAKSPLKEFEPKAYMAGPNLESLIRLNNKEFKEKYINHSCGWRGKNILIRNALINYFLLHGKDKIEIKKSITSPYIEEYYKKLFT